MYKTRRKFGRGSRPAASTSVLPENVKLRIRMLALVAEGMEGVASTAMKMINRRDAEGLLLLANAWNAGTILADELMSKNRPAVH